MKNMKRMIYIILKEVTRHPNTQESYNSTDIIAAHSNPTEATGHLRELRIEAAKGFLNKIDEFLKKMIKLKDAEEGLDEEIFDKIINIKMSIPRFSLRKLELI